jgi:branched-subunit amino acid ABC-type transport system permease component
MEAELAYMLAATAVEYLIRSSGERGLELFLSTWRESRSFEGALRSVYGVTQGQFEEDWQEYVKRRYGWFLLATHSLVFWLAVTLVLLLLVWIRRRRNRLAMARLRATEPPERPAYWADGEGDEGTNATDPRSSSEPGPRTDENG